MLVLYSKLAVLLLEICVEYNITEIVIIKLEGYVAAHGFSHYSVCVSIYQYCQFPWLLS